MSEVMNNSFIRTAPGERFKAVLGFFTKRYLKYNGLALLWFFSIYLAFYLLAFAWGNPDRLHFHFNEVLLIIVCCFAQFSLVRGELELMTQVGMKRWESFVIFISINFILALMIPLLMLLSPLGETIFRNSSLIIESVFLSLYSKEYVVRHTVFDPYLLGFIITLFLQLCIRLFSFVLYGVSRRYRVLIAIMLFIFWAYCTSHIPQEYIGTFFGIIFSSEDTVWIYQFDFSNMMISLSVLSVLFLGLIYLVIRRKSLVGFNR